MNVQISQTSFSHVSLPARNGIIHRCRIIIRIGGMLGNLVQPVQQHGAEWSWLNVVMSNAELSSSAAGSNVLRQPNWLSQPLANCAQSHEQLKQHFPGNASQECYSCQTDIAASTGAQCDTIHFCRCV